MSESSRKEAIAAIEEKIPYYILNPLKNYLMFGDHPGDTLKAFIAGDLFGFFHRADEETKESIQALVSYVKVKGWSIECYGSVEKFNNWISRKGMTSATRV